MGPFIHKFETARHKYIYDVHCNRVFRVSPQVYDLADRFPGRGWRQLLRDFPQHSSLELTRGWREIRQLRKTQQGFSSSRPVRLEFAPGRAHEEMVRQTPREQLILNVTDRCNLRCTYCSYSGRYPGRRRHGHRDLSFETAQMALDLFFRQAADHPFVTFYGGEPLLNLRLIKKVVEYVGHCHPGPVQFGLTTNGVLLSAETGAFLRRHDFNLRVSLDGPQDLHDRYRVDSRGRGTYETVCSNLKLLHSLDGDYFRRKVCFSTVSAPPHGLREVREFFSGTALLEQQDVNFSFINPDIENFPAHPSAQDQERERRDRGWLADRYLEEVRRGVNPDAFLRGVFEKDFVQIHQRPRLPLGESIPLNGCCFPGARRLFVSVAGELHVCEKLDEAYPLGTVAQGVNPDLVGQLLKEYISLSETCLTCWACRLCSACFAVFTRKGRLNAEARVEECRGLRDTLHQRFVQYYTLLDENSSVWDFLNDVVTT